MGRLHFHGIAILPHTPRLMEDPSTTLTPPPSGTALEAPANSFHGRLGTLSWTTRHRFPRIALVPVASRPLRVRIRTISGTAPALVLWLCALLATALFPVSSSSGRELDLEKPSSKLRRFASDVIFTVEAGDREKISKRLPKSIIARIQGQPGQIAIAERHLKDLCKITGVERIEAAAPDKIPAKVDLYFGPKEELVPVAREMDAKITLDRGYTFWTWWDENGVIERAAVFIATDKLSGAAFEDRLIEQLFGAFGLPGRSKEFDESCLSLKEQVLTSLQPLDKAMLEFYYRAVPAGSGPRDVDTLFREEWSRKP